MKIESVHIDSISDVLSKCSIVRQKRERAVLYDSGTFYKVWVQNWTQSEITKHCFDIGFYDEKNASSVISLIHDDVGPRGYVQKQGSTVEKRSSPKSWSKFNELTTYKTRAEFILDIIEKSVAADGTYSDLAPSNVIMFDESVNLVDLESFRSFGLVFDGNKSSFESFDLSAWWKPRETAARDIDKYFKVYFGDCLNIDLNFDLNDRDAFHKMLDIAKAIVCNQ